MKRGDIWIGAGAAAYLGKPRPLAIIQSDRVESYSSIVVCPVTGSPETAGPMRPLILAGERNGLLRDSCLMVEKLSAMPREKLVRRIGELSTDELTAVSSALAELLGLTA